MNDLGRWQELLFQSVGTTADAETAMTAWTPTKTAKLIAIVIDAAYVAATSLIESGYVKLSCPTFGGIDLIANFNGVGLGTAPRPHNPMNITVCNLQVTAGTPVKGAYYHNVTPVTPELLVYGIFEG